MDQQSEPRSFENVINEIRTAFDSVPYPSRLVRGTTADYDDVTTAFRGIRWQEVPARTIEQNRNGLPFFSPEGLHYYLPAFMVYGLQNLQNSDVVFNTIIGLKPSEQMRLTSRRFSKAQSDAVKSFLEALAALDDGDIDERAKDALDELTNYF